MADTCHDKFLHSVWKETSHTSSEVAAGKIFFPRAYIFAWTYYWPGLITSLSVFLFLIYVLIRRKVFVYISKIYEWHEIRAGFAFWLKINEILPWKYIVLNRSPIFLDSALFYEFLSPLCVWSRFIKFIGYI